MGRLLLNLQGIGLSFGGTPLLKGAELMLSEGDRICLVGRNGSGKSTLLKIAAGLLEPDTGDRFLQPGVTVRYLPQEPDFSGFETVLAYVEAGLGPLDNPYRARQLLDDLGLSGAEHPAQLSGGEARRASLARTLAPAPDILFLDEPTNHLDLPAIEWLENTLKTLRSSFVLISHDRRFLEALSQQVVWLDRGQSRRLNRGFVHFESWRDQIFEEEEREQALLAQRIATEEQWMRYGVTARRKRNMRRVALLGALRKERKEHLGKLGTVKLEASMGDVSGRLVAELNSVTKGFSGQNLVNKLDLLVLRGDRLAIVGPNGAGKTTILKLITGVLEPDAGSVKLGTNLQTIVLDQSRQSLDPTQRAQDVITGGRGSTVTLNGETKHVVTYMKDFLFRPEQARTPVSVLSGGERARLILARELAKPSNLLILDEPTNDLDLETLDLLEDMLADYQGTILLVSHDRDFIDRLATSVLMYEAPGRWIEYAGGYTDMIAQRGQGVVAKAMLPPAKSAPVRAEVQATGPANPRKLSFKQKHALQVLPGQIEALRREIEQLSTQISDSSLYARDPKLFEAQTKRLSSAQIELLQAEDQWLELELLREELES